MSFLSNVMVRLFPDFLLEELHYHQQKVEGLERIVASYQKSEEIWNRLLTGKDAEIAMQTNIITHGDQIIEKQQGLIELYRISYAQLEKELELKALYDTPEMHRLVDESEGAFISHDPTEGPCHQCSLTFEYCLCLKFYGTWGCVEHCSAPGECYCPRCDGPTADPAEQDGFCDLCGFVCTLTHE